MPRSLSGLDVGSFDDMDINGNIVVEGGTTLGTTLTGTSPGTVCTNLNLTNNSNSILVSNNSLQNNTISGKAQNIWSSCHFQ